MSLKKGFHLLASVQYAALRKGSFGPPAYRVLGPDISLLKMGMVSRGSGKAENNSSPQDITIMSNMY